MAKTSFASCWSFTLWTGPLLHRWAFLIKSKFQSKVGKLPTMMPPLSQTFLRFSSVFSSGGVGAGSWTCMVPLRRPWTSTFNTSAVVCHSSPLARGWGDLFPLPGDSHLLEGRHLPLDPLDGWYLCGPCSVLRTSWDFPSTVPFSGRGCQDSVRDFKSTSLEKPRYGYRSKLYPAWWIPTWLTVVDINPVPPPKNWNINVFVFLCMFGIFPNRRSQNWCKKSVFHHYSLFKGHLIDIPFPGRLKYHPADYIYIYIHV